MLSFALEDARRMMAQMLIAEADSFIACGRAEIIDVRWSVRLFRAMSIVRNLLKILR